MKAYILGFKSNPTKLQFGPEPEARYETREQAESECQDLNRSDICVGVHQCSFSVDPLPEGDFGILCICHPYPGSLQ